VKSFHANDERMSAHCVTESAEWMMSCLLCILWPLNNEQETELELTDEGLLGGDLMTFLLSRQFRS
jgi:hypothetical protein